MMVMMFTGSVFGVGGMGVGWVFWVGWVVGAFLFLSFFHR